ncbi:UbiA family prenyltransferase [Amycolatopsis nigrescens]|uniref:UbiA family prenyltransferase n=1 Tax=Amycolatopsis nigrescens TaxID=381445 RepID=UPI0003699F96|nr:UbiA family prenyltransferase [Amycolatopsis nigrescens]
MSDETKETGTRGGPAKLAFLLRCCSCRFTAYYWMGFCAGLAMAGQLTVGWALLALPWWFAYSTGTEALNRVADREEDAINRPERTWMCEQVGWANLRWVAIGSWVVFALIGVGVLWRYPSFALAGTAIVSSMIAIGYSVGPTFKRHRLLALLALTTPMITPLCMGWAVGGSLPVLLGIVLPAGCALVLFSLGLGGIKDITDIEGDRAVNYSSLWLSLLTSRRGLAIYAAICLPACVTVLGVLFADLPPSSLGVLPFVFVSALVVTAASRAKTTEERGVAREVMHLYTQCYLALYLLLAVPSAGMAVVTGAGIACWLVTSRWLHWSGGMDAARWRRWASLLPGPESRRPAH